MPSPHPTTTTTTPTCSSEGASSADPPSPSRVEVDLDAVVENLSHAARAAGHGGYAVVKADAYGHGAEAVVRRLLRLAPEVCRGFCVARPEEAERLLSRLPELARDAGRVELLVLGVFPALLGEERRRELARSRARLGWVPTVGGLDDLAAWAEVAAMDRPVPLHLELDIGMRRSGFDPALLSRAGDILQSSPGLQLRGVFGHFSESEVAGSDVTAQQRRRFAEVVAAHPWLASGVVHLDNTCGLPRDGAGPGEGCAGNLGLPPERLSFRLGGGLYGLDLRRDAGAGSAGRDGEPEWPRPAMRVTTRLAALRPVRRGEGVGYNSTYRAAEDRLIGLLPIGYADGVPRAARGAEVLVGGRRRALAGTVSMDLCCVDLGRLDDEGASHHVGDTVVLLGATTPESPAPSSAPSAAVSAGEWARWSGTISYEVTCRFAQRLPRSYTSSRLPSVTAPDRSR
ncbi:MAG: alanine racemase [Acidobacteria bacterium]|nr:MAG: alanine racemase [Acidobacteriota bacterium]REK10394.1 MAG: alanine racemase [Acidobacteriota bacterium]